MDVLIVGAGAAGLSLAALLAESEARHNVTVVERGRPSDRPGFGITLRAEATAFLQVDEMMPCVHLNGRALWLAGEPVVDLPNPPSTHLICFPRAAFVSALTRRCLGAGVQVRYGSDASTLTQDELDAADLVVAADGADSALRARYATWFRPDVAVGRHRYGWFGVDAPLPKLTIMLPAGTAALAWGYEYSDTASTFIVECTEDLFQDAGLAELDAAETARIIGTMFADELEGATVSCGDSARWIRFTTVTNRRLRHRNIVLVGDAAHTTHYSQGIGTMFAFDDVQTLASALDQHGDVESALAAYEETQQPKIMEYQAIASASMRWAERLVAAAGRDDEAGVHALVEQRWPGNAVPPGPLDSGDRSPTHSDVN